MKAWVGKLFEYMFWADDRALELLGGAEAARQPDVLRLMSHVISAERIWMKRVRGEDTTGLAVWPDWNWEELLHNARETKESYRAFMEELNPAGLDRPVSYRNSSGARFETLLIDVLTHVALHGSYHRGQIASAIRRAGGEPVNTDYIVYDRSVPLSAG